MSTEHLHWPPPYQFRVSKRCKHLQMRITPNKGLEVISPSQLSERKIREFLDSKQAWIRKHLVVATTPQLLLPSAIALQALRQTWSVDYQHANNKRILVAGNDQQQLAVVGNIDDIAACVAALRDWLVVTAERHLPVWLYRISQQLQLPFADCSIRSQRTRWGSCSHDRRISLNSKLLFLPTVLVEHVLIHELCHTIHLDHSAAFWRLLSSFDPHCQQHKRQLKQANQFVADWCE